MKYLLILAFYLVLSPAQAAGLNDVSILLPLPRDLKDFALMLAPSDHDLVPAEIINQLPPPILNSENPANERGQMRVVGIRFDPCFSEGEVPFRCQHQIRLVFQPLSTREGYALPADAAMHSFYTFDDAAWTRVLDDWRAWAGDTNQTPLQIHPLIRKEGLIGPHWGQLRNLILHHCGPSNLVRVTTASSNSFGTIWSFTGLDVGPGRNLALIRIPFTQGATTQFIFIDNRWMQEFFGQIRPAPFDQPAWNDFLKDSVSARNGSSKVDLAQVMVRATEFENPTKFHSGNRDCVSCHVAQTVQLWGEASFSKMPFDAGIIAAKFTSPYNLKNESVDAFNTNHVRAFGYFQTAPIFSQRLINETAVVAAEMSLNSSPGQ